VKKHFLTPAPPPVKSLFWLPLDSGDNWRDDGETLQDESLGGRICPLDPDRTPLSFSAAHKSARVGLAPPGRPRTSQPSDSGVSPPQSTAVTRSSSPTDPISRTRQSKTLPGIQAATNSHRPEQPIPTSGGKKNFAHSFSRGRGCLPGGHPSLKPVGQSAKGREEKEATSSTALSGSSAPCSSSPALRPSCSSRHRKVCVPTGPLLHAGRPRPLSRRSKPGLRGWAQPEDRGGGRGGTRLPTHPPGASRTNLRPAVPSAHLRGLPLVLRPRRGSPDCDRQSQNHDPVTGASGGLQPSDSSSEKAAGARATSRKLGRL